MQLLEPIVPFPLHLPDHLVLAKKQPTHEKPQELQHVV